METARFRFTDERTVSLEFKANIATVEQFGAGLVKALMTYAARHPQSRAVLHMHHNDRWMPLNRDSGCESIVARVADPKLWGDRLAQEILDIWSDTVSHSDQIKSLISSASAQLERE